MNEENRQEFKIDFDWLARERGSQLDKATFAEITLEIDGNIASEVQDSFSKTTRKAFRASAYDLAYWFACNWWRLRWEAPGAIDSDWQMSHQLCGIGNGYVWPNITLYCDGHSMNVRSLKSHGHKIEPIRFLSDFLAGVNIKTFENAVDNFIFSIIDRMNQQNLNNSNLQLVWKEVLKERSQTDSYNWRKLEAILGFDPDEGPEGLITTLLEKSAVFGPGAIDEISSATKTAAIETLETLRERTSDATKQAKIPYFSELRKQLSKELRAQDFPWQQGEFVAGVMRKALNLGIEPVRDETLNDIFSLSQQVIDNVPTDVQCSISAGYREESTKDRVNLFLPARVKTSRRFALLRIVGDHLRYDTTDKLLAVTEAKTSRQKFQRSFAREFLCPFNGLMEILGDEPLTDVKIEEAAEYYGVSPLAVTTTLVNKGRIDRSGLEPWDWYFNR
ncbi:MAG TPA: hypothetical protein PKN29_14640 [Candidatus Ozemobacteraceae bacterium]|nr:hypothetical protein [Candidatus Ozemobacteraceae bacterium]